MAFGGNSIDFFILCYSYANRTIQQIHDYNQPSPTWPSDYSASEEVEGPTHSISSDQLAAILQLQFDDEDHLLAAERADLVAAEQSRVFLCGLCENTLPEESITRIEPCGHQFCRECVRGHIVSQVESRRSPVFCPTCTAATAAMLQLQFDEEDHLLAAEHAELVSAEQQRVFVCGLCENTLPEESITRIEPCGHPFCRECVRGYIVSQIKSRCYPVFCPTCTAVPGKNHESIGS